MLSAGTPDRLRLHPSHRAATRTGSSPAALRSRARKRPKRTRRVRPPHPAGRRLPYRQVGLTPRTAQRAHASQAGWGR